jgi:hypothetical protein
MAMNIYAELKRLGTLPIGGLEFPLPEHHDSPVGVVQPSCARGGSQAAIVRPSCSMWHPISPEAASSARSPVTLIAFSSL